MREARKAAREYTQDARLDPALIESIVLCVSEAVSNAILHGYSDGHEPRELGFEILVEANGVRVRVSDDGTGMLPGNATTGAGYGLAIIDRLASKVTLASGHNLGTQIDMFFS